MYSDLHYAYPVFPLASPIPPPALRITPCYFYAASFSVQQSKHFLALWLWLCLDRQLDLAETSANVDAAS